MKIFYLKVRLMCVLFLSGAAAGSLDASDVTTTQQIYTVQVDQTLVKIPESFLGFSIDYPDLESFILHKGKPNHVFINLCENLEPNNNGSPTLRIGGKSTDSSWWNPNGETPPPGINFNITKKFAIHLRDFTAFTGSELILGLNMAQDNPQIAIDWARAAWKILKSIRIIAFEIGNEPDLYGVAAYPGGQFTNPISHEPTARPSTWSFSDYLTDFNLFSYGLKGDLPKIPLAGQVYANYQQDIYSPFFLGNELNFLNSQRQTLSLVTQHVYPLDGCDPGNPSLSDLLSPSSSDDVGAIIASYADLFPMQISELNSVSCGGIDGISNVFGSALWMADILFELAKAGVTGVDVTISNSNLSTPFSFQVVKADKIQLTVNPVYYGMLLFAQATGNHHRLLNIIQPANADPLVKVWAALDHHEDIFHIVVINKNSGSGSANIAISIPDTKRRAFWVSLQAPDNNVLARTGITLAGRTFDGSKDGEIHGKPVRNNIHPNDDGLYLLNVPNSSAVMLTVPWSWHSE